MMANIKSGLIMVL
jgi:hypothetical protein